MTRTCINGCRGRAVKAGECKTCLRRRRTAIAKAARNGEVPPAEAANPALAPWLEALAMPDWDTGPDDLGPAQPPLGRMGVVERNQRVVDVMRANGPGLSTDAVAERFGLSRGAVSQLARRNGVETDMQAYLLPAGFPAGGQ